MVLNRFRPRLRVPPLIAVLSMVLLIRGIVMVVLLVSTDENNDENEEINKANCPYAGHKFCLDRHFADCLGNCTRNGFYNGLGRLYYVDWCLEGSREKSPDVCFCCSDYLKLVRKHHDKSPNKNCLSGENGRDQDIVELVPSSGKCPLRGHQICLLDGRYANCVGGCKRSGHMDGLGRLFYVDWCVEGVPVKSEKAAKIENEKKKRKKKQNHHEKDHNFENDENTCDGTEKEKEEEEEDQQCFCCDRPIPLEEEEGDGDEDAKEEASENNTGKEGEEDRIQLPGW